ncbi:MAG: serine protease [Candidatus Woesearchaeota archaeon]|jgi:S1-C subfamily serine protease
MSKLINLIKSTAIISGTGLAAYSGIELGEKIAHYLPQSYMLPKIAQGFSAFFLGFLANIPLITILGTKKISEIEAYSISALNAFANANNDARKISTEKSLEEISNNLVEVIVDNGNKVTKGSGLMITTDGYVITAHHVIDGMIINGGKAKIKLQNGKSYSVKKENVWYNKNTDVAVIKAAKGMYFSRPIKVKVDQDSKLNRGDEVRILGFRDGQKYNTMGMVTNPSHTWKQDNGNVVYDLFQTDARGKQGQSGGVIANGDGELIGICVYSSTRNGEDIGVIGGAKLSNALTYINQIAAKKSAKMFDYKL